ncbi:hypothetical protein N7520_005437 [Penicillium odoratum]|uniref:uncharacterized protein n=1 Tax=Penicillium odoratum TaxID=1167516 RepID=UPI002548AE1D|nr:uncharacterized protein N7520_005437 [Penicillium odoratum]KAJ5765878.1 hypothetical protein N7520_005437 [Penicillium odoratum]
MSTTEPTVRCSPTMKSHREKTWKEGVIPENQEDRPPPPRPTYSPVTPVFAQLEPVAAKNATIVPPPLSPSPTNNTPHQIYRPPPPPVNPPVFKPEPPPVPISESDNPDAIALRSAISILQMQKQQSLRDIKSLDRLKEAAAADPEGFARELAAGRLRTEDRGAIIQFSDEMDIDEDDKENPKQTQGGSPSAFARIPQPQNVVRMPPINWAKYHVTGEPLDRMHEEQLRRPDPGEPRREPAPEHILASPYRPLVDQLDTPARLGRPTKTKK